MGDRIPAGASARPSVALVLVLALLAAFAPFATDIYLAAFPVMAVDLHTTATGVQLSLTAFLIGAGVGQVFFGPLSDRRGRRGPLVIGLTVCVVASVATTLAPSAEVLVATRLIQGLAGSAGMVIGRAVITDVARGPAAARLFSLVMMVNGVAPIVAPMIGSFLISLTGWRGLLGVVAVISLVSLTAVLVVIPESNPPESRALAQAARTATGRSGLTSRAYLANTLTLAFAFAGMMGYISASPFLYQEVIGLSAVQYGLMFGLNALALSGVSALSARLVGRVAPERLASIGLTIYVLSTMTFGLLAWLGATGIWLAVTVLVLQACLGLVFGNTTAAALAAVPHATGRGSAFIGALQFGSGALVSPLVGLGGGHSPLPLALVLIVASLLTMAAHVVARTAATKESY